AVALALVGIFRGRSSVRFAYLAGLVVAFEITRGANSAAYLWLFEHVAVFRGLRSAARAEILVLASLAVLSGYGVAFLMGTFTTAKRQALAAGTLLLLLIAEYASAPVLT